MKYYEVTFTVKTPQTSFHDACDILSAMAGEVGFESFEETADSIKGYVQQDLFDREALEALVESFPLPHSTVSFEVKEAEYKDWNEEWEKGGFDPIVVADRLIIHDGRHLPKGTTGSDYIFIEIDTRMAFGTGTHSTTQMMVATLLNMDIAGRRVLDCGTGTGILSIAALKLGAGGAVGYDIDEWSVDNALHNAIINRVDDRFNCLYGDSSVVGQVEGFFDIVMANINRNTLLADMSVMVDKLTAGGHIAISGFYAADVPMLVDKARPLRLTLQRSMQDGDWACLHFVKM